MPFPQLRYLPGGGAPAQPLEDSSVVSIPAATGRPGRDCLIYFAFFFYGRKEYTVHSAL